MTLRRYVVVPSMDGGLENLREIAGNLWFSWNPEAVEIFDHLDEQLWEQTDHNPLQVLIRLSSNRLAQIREDEGYRSHVEKVCQRFRTYVKGKRSYDFGLDQPLDFTTAYFSLEFGLTDCVPIYSGGLGLLAGDHLKSASDLNVPLVGVGIMYQEGYFRQRLSPDGWQQEQFPRTEFDALPLEKATDASGAPIRVAVDLAGETIWLRVLRLRVGRIPLYLLDADIPENPPHLRGVTARLYGGDQEMRVRQEIVLGIGGSRALSALGINARVFHLNEGHAAFVLFEKLRYYIEEERLSFEEAREMVTSQSLLTIHTPVPAGNDVFPRALMEKYFSAKVRTLGIDFDAFMGLGRRNPHDSAEGFCMPVLGLRLTTRTNGVSKLHAHVARQMWREVWPQADLEEVPIVAVTNGVHIPSYISKDLAKLYDRYLGPGWTEDPDSEKIWQRVEQIPDTELWRTHDRCRARLVSFARRRLAKQLKAGRAPAGQVEAAEHVLNPEILTVCFARRFATYKRATLLFRDPDRLAGILNDPDRPMQIIMAGKAHPADDTGKELIRQISRFAKEERFRSRLVFIEDYEINVARYMVQGADVWLNTPRRPLEACGTSGMKAAANGALNLSILDGWWDEGYAGDNGWAIGLREEYKDLNYQDEIESRALYDILGEGVKPMFYELGADDLPREWIQMMKRSLASACPAFNSHRMVCDYIEGFYVPAARSSAQLKAGNYQVLREMVAWKKRMREDWDRISIAKVELRNEAQACKGKELGVEVSLDTAGHGPEELTVELIHGPMTIRQEFRVRHVTRLVPVGPDPSDGERVLFSGNIPLGYTGLYGYRLRVTPNHPNLAFSHRLNLLHAG
ncbi:MAG: alpha-glucan family phosphorylase [Thermodesulfobacteriota bacterium]